MEKNCKLFSPRKINKLEIKNRIIMAPMITNYSDNHGHVTDRQMAYYLARSIGGAGCIIFEHTGITDDGIKLPTNARISTDEHQKSFKRLIDAVHAVDGKIFIQLNHTGRQGASAVTGKPLIGPSAIPCPGSSEVPIALNIDKIREMTEAYGRAALRAKEAGADGIELHMGHGYLLCQFLSPFSNKRDDEYGGSTQNRMKFPIEVVANIRKKVGTDYPIISRISADEFIEGGLTIDESLKICVYLEKCGIDAIHVSASLGATYHMNMPTYYSSEIPFVNYAKKIKAKLTIPVIAVGGIRTPDIAKHIIDEDIVDFVAMGRALIADPELPRKTLEGRIDKIRPCIACNRCAMTSRKGNLQCAVNPLVGREESFKINDAIKPKKVWIVGGGPAGMKAAEIASIRGHEVTLFEQNQKLGGRFLLASIPPCKSKLKNYIDYMERQLNQLPVKIQLSKRFKIEMLNNKRPDVLIIATGARSICPKIKGIEKANCISGEDILAGKETYGKKVVIIGGGGIGCEITDYISEKAGHVTLIEMKEQIAMDLVVHLQYFLRKRLEDKGVKIMTSTKAISFEEGSLIVESPQGIHKFKNIDNYVITCGLEPNNELMQVLATKLDEVYIIGDASKPREIMEAVLEGMEVALKV